MLTAFDQSNPTIIFDPSTSTYEIIYEGKVLTTTVTHSPSIITKWVEEIISQYEGKPATVGFDIKWQSPLKLHLAKKKKKPATLQFCIGGNCLIIQLCIVPVIPEALKRFLINPNFTFASVKGPSKMAKLKKVYGLQCSRIKTILLPTKALGISRLWRSTEFGQGKKIKKPKHVRRSSWEVMDLSDDQILYASLDAYASFCNASPLGFMRAMFNLEGGWTKKSSYRTNATFEMCG